MGYPHWNWGWDGDCVRLWDWDAYTLCNRDRDGVSYWVRERPVDWDGDGSRDDVGNRVRDDDWDGAGLVDWDADGDRVGHRAGHADGDGLRHGHGHARVVLGYCVVDGVVA